jgi:large subunit ribosomal protein L18
MGHLAERELGRRARHRRLRKKVVGLPERPRLAVFRSHQHFYAQVIDDMGGKTLLGCSTSDKRLKDAIKDVRPIDAAQALGKLLADEAKKQGITQVVFDRGGYLYHGRVKAFAEAVRAGGLNV